MTPVARIVPAIARPARVADRLRVLRGFAMALALGLCVSGCGYKTPLELPKKPAPTRPAP